MRNPKCCKQFYLRLSKQQKKSLQLELQDARCRKYGATIRASGLVQCTFSDEDATMREASKEWFDDLTGVLERAPQSDSSFAHDLQQHPGMAERQRRQLHKCIQWVKEDELVHLRQEHRWDGGLRSVLGVLGYTDYRPLQQEICNAMLEGANCIVQMPTGATKVYGCSN